MNNEKELVHYGVVGMRWGIRRARRSERINLERASKAWTNNRKEKFVERANKNRAKADSLKNELKERKAAKKQARMEKLKTSKAKDVNPQKVSNGKKKAAVILSTFLAASVTADLILNKEQNKAIVNFVKEWRRVK